jgi:hypothetical protein
MKSFGYRKHVVQLSKTRFFGYFLSVGRLLCPLGVFFAGFLEARDHDKSPGISPFISRIVSTKKDNQSSSEFPKGGLSPYQYPKDVPMAQIYGEVIVSYPNRL